MSIEREPIARVKNSRALIRRVTAAPKAVSLEAAMQWNRVLWSGCGEELDRDAKK
jgi:hypothetical protein